MLKIKISGSAGSGKTSFGQQILDLVKASGKSVTLIEKEEPFYEAQLLRVKEEIKPDVLIIIKQS